jgi:hypothetical protein
MALTAFNPRSFDLSDTYAFTGTVSGTNVGGGSLVKISEQTASASASISFTSGIDSTYRTYCFKFINIHLSHTSNADFGFQGSTNGGSSYNTTITSTFFDAFHYENDSSTGLRYLGTRDLAQATTYQPLSVNTSSQDADQSMSGELWLYNPSSTTYVKHFMATINTASDGGADDFTDNSYVAGYFNTTSAINAIDFKHPSGDIDDGTIIMYGIA